MKTPTKAGQAEAARRVVPRAAWDCSPIATKHAFAIACDELLVKDAELATAKAVLGEVHRIAEINLWANALAQHGPHRTVATLAAPYAVVVDPLVEVCEVLGLGRSQTVADALRGALNERGITVPEIGQ